MPIVNSNVLTGKIEQVRKFTELVQSFQFERSILIKQLMDLSPDDRSMRFHLMQRIQEIDREIESHRP